MKKGGDTQTNRHTTPTRGRIIVADGIYSVGDKNMIFVLSRNEKLVRRGNFVKYIGNPYQSIPYYLSRPKAAQGLKLWLRARPFRTTLLFNVNGVLTKH